MRAFIIGALLVAVARVGLSVLGQPTQRAGRRKN
jgi:hypothetical protein